MIDQKFRIRVCMLYDFKQGKTANESHRSLGEVFHDDAPLLHECQSWFQRFREGDESLGDEEEQQISQAIDKNALQIGHWRGYDPRDDDWICSYYEGQCLNGPRVCFGCHRPRLLTEEEKEQIRKSEHSGEELYKRVMAGEYVKDKLDAMVEGFRQWYRLPTQVLRIGGKHYVFVAIMSDKDEDLASFFFTGSWQEAKEHTFSEPKSLNVITQEICDIIRENDK